MPRFPSDSFRGIAASAFGARCCFAFAASFKASVLAANGQALFWSQPKTRRKTSGLCTEPFLKSAHRSDSSFATVCSSFLENVLTPDQMQSFGWRIPFWASAVLVVIGLYVRRRLQETPLFKLAQERDNTTRSPLREVFKSNWKEILKGTFLMGATYAMFFTLTTWSLSYATTALGFSHSEFYCY